MPSIFWPKKAWETNLVLPAGNWAIADEPDSNAERLRQAVDPFWAEKISKLDPAWLTPGALERFKAIRSSINADTAIGAGFELVEMAILDPDYFWFFELGMIAWMARLAELRQAELLPDTSGRKAAKKIEEIWANQGPQAVCDQLDKATQKNPTTDTTVALYRLPLAIWHERDMVLAAKLLDHLARRLDGDIVARMGATWPLTFGLVHSLRGDLGLAETLLNETKLASRPRGWRGLGMPEAQYQRARYLWGLENKESTETALQLVEEVLSSAPVYVLRMLQDPGFNQVNIFETQALQTLANRLLMEASGTWTRWQQSQGAGLDEDPKIARVQETVRKIGPEGYVLLAAAKALPEAGVRQAAKFDRAFLATVERLRSFLTTLPDTMTLRLGEEGDAPQIVGSDDSELERLNKAMEKPGEHTLLLVDKLEQTIPGALRMGLVGYGLMLSQALTTSGELVESELTEASTAAGRKRLKEIVALLNDCVAQVEPIKEVGRSGREKDQSILGVGAELSRQVVPVWSAFMSIQERWARNNLTSFGRMNIMPDLLGGEVQINTGGFSAIRVIVSDGTGTPLAGVPVLWRIASGPAKARGTDSHLAEYIDVSLKSGRAILSVESGKGRAGETGKIDIQVLGQRAPVTISYRLI